MPLFRAENRVIAILFALGLAACTADPAPAATEDTAVLAGTTEAKVPAALSIHGRRGLEHKTEKGKTTPQDPRVPDDVAALLDLGFGLTLALPGETWTVRTPDGLPPPPPGKNRKRLAGFVHLADAQLADDESPSRVCSFDNFVVSAGFRAQDGFGCHLLDAAVRTANALTEDVAVDFVVLGGDNADSAQGNEVAWFGAVLAGGTVECDSGADDGQTAGLSFPQKTAFQAQGLKMPWFWVSGNHDLLVQGNWSVDQGRIVTAIGSEASTGTRDYRLPGAPVVEGEVPADAKRAHLQPKALLDAVRALPVGSGPAGHGLAGLPPQQTHANYRVTPVANVPLDLVVVDTAAHTGSASGLVRQREFDAEIKPALDAALAAGHWVIVTHHHATWSLTHGGSIFGEQQADAMTPEAYRAAISNYPNVVMILAGHSHRNHVELHLPGPSGVTRPLWEVQTASIVDWPSQLRLLELIDEGGPWLSLRITVADVQAEIGGKPANALVKQALALVTLDKASGWNPGTGDGEAADRNAVLWIEKPMGFAAKP